MLAVFSPVFLKKKKNWDFASLYMVFTELLESQLQKKQEVSRKSGEILGSFHLFDSLAVSRFVCSKCSLCEFISTIHAEIIGTAIGPR